MHQKNRIKATDERPMFRVTKEEANSAQEWLTNHLKEIHFLSTPEEQTAFNVENGGAYSITFSPTAIGTKIECTCNVCAQAAFRDTRGDLGMYREYLLKNDAYKVIRQI